MRLTLDEMRIVAAAAEQYPSGIPAGAWGCTPEFWCGDEVQFPHKLDIQVLENGG